MKVHISLNVSDIDKSVAFYSKMLSEDPVKYIVRDQDDIPVSVSSNPIRPGARKAGYAKFDIADPPLNLVLSETEHESGDGLSHLGLQVESTDDVLRFQQKWIDEGLVTIDEMGVDCCYAKQDKTWVSDPDGNEWEAFVVLENLEPSLETESCDCSNKVSEYVETAKQAVASCCSPATGDSIGSQPSNETCCQSN